MNPHKVITALAFVLSFSFIPSVALAEEAGACCRNNREACTEYSDANHCIGDAQDWLPGETCESSTNNLCQVSACCTGTGCVQATSQFCKLYHGTDHITHPDTGASLACDDPIVTAMAQCVEAEPTVACCHPQHPVSHICSDLTESECANQGGTPIGGDCTDTDLQACPAPPTVACCHDADVDGVNETCSEAAEEACIDQGGTVIGSSCDAQDVGACPATPTGACCLQNGECLDDYTEGQCNDIIGASYAGDGFDCHYTGAMSQQIANCQSQVGACCLPDGSCLDDQTQESCDAQSGSFTSGALCNDPTVEEREPTGVVCSTQDGACCKPDGSCLDNYSEEKCGLVGGSFAGYGTNCSDGSFGEPDFAGDNTNIVCPVLGACCSHDGCQDLSESDCLATDGNQFIATSLCEEITDTAGMCVFTEPTSACCVGDKCENLSEADCTEAGGVIIGGDCDDNDLEACPVVTVETVACCVGDQCKDLTEEDCIDQNGTPIGGACDDANLESCPVTQEPIGACCNHEGCADLSQEECEAVDGNVFLGEGVLCAEIPLTDDGQCILATESACCLPGGDCINAHPAECHRVQGTVLEGNCEDEDVVCEQPGGACCLNAVSGVQCAEDFTLEHCRVLDGVYLGDDSLCTDDVDCSVYFNNEPVGGCCLPNGDCVDDQTFKDCVTQLEGSWLGENEMCDEEVSCHVPTSACCLPAGDCIETTAENCHALGGDAMGDDITDCQAGLCTEALGSCCTAVGCLNLTETACEIRNGTFDPDSDHCLNLDSAFCPSAVGACCSASGCSEITPEDCSAEGGNYYGDGVLCSDAEVDCGNAPGACCVDGDCANIPEESCADLGGQFYGANVLCDSPQVMCEQAPIGACCGGENLSPCEDIDREKCLDSGGQWYDGVSCDDPSEIFECPVKIGCCLEQGDCIELEPGRCEALGGTVAGDSCETDEGPVTCPDLTGPQGGCCLPDGSCTYMGEEACTDVNGQWLGEDEPCPEDAGASGTNGSGNIISTGNDTMLIGHFNDMIPVPELWPLGDEPASALEYTRWMSINEPTTDFSTYYHRYPTPAEGSTYPLPDQNPPWWDCASDEGTKLNTVIKIRMSTTLEDPSLRNTDYYNFQDLLDALMASPYYAGELQNGDGFSEMAIAIHHSDANGNHNPWIIFHDTAEDCFTYEDTTIAMCPVSEEGACCLPSGECTQLSEEACADVTGEWLGAGEPCPETAPVGQVEYVSTGLDTNEIGNFNNLSPVPALWSPASTTDHDYIQAISSAEPATPFANYYFEDTQHPAMTQEAAPYWCAGDNGNSLKNVMFIRLTQAFTDPALRNTEHHSFVELANSVRNSADYSNLPTDVDWAGLKNAITYTDPDIGVIQPYVIISRLASLCYEEVEPMLSTCPAPIACCLPEGCYQLSEHACEERGGVVVGDDCNDEDIECGNDNGSGDDPGACCAEGACLSIDAETCSITYQGIFYNDAAQCLDECIPVQGACCLNNGSCIDATENGCEDNNGEWLGPDTDCPSLASSNTGGIVSTGWDINETGNFGSAILLAPYGGAPTSTGDHLQWMSLNEPQSDLDKYYFQGLVPANQTAAGNWQCAGDQGNRIHRRYAIQIGDSLDASLSYTTYWTFADLRNAMIGSSAYPSVNAYSTYFEVRDALHLGVAGSEVMSIFGQIAMSCFRYEDDTSQCPVKDACCIDGVCSDLTTEECEAQGGTVVGDDCGDPDIVCESTNVPCCINGACLNVDWEECMASGGALTEGDCDIENICPQPAGACCINDTCVDGYNAEKCEDEGGSYYGNGSDCDDPNIVCGGGDRGGCCLPDGTCTDLSYGACAESGGHYLGDGILCDDQVDAGNCESPTIGACCLDGECSETTAEKCHYFGGQYFGDGSDCVPGLCDSDNGLGGCCVQGSCVEPVSEASCNSHSGEFLPDGCEEDSCGGVHRGACCVAGSCTVLYEDECAAVGGAYLGDDEPCTDEVECPAEIGACCMPDGSCEDSEREKCDDAGGLYLTVPCDEAECPLPMGACCMPDGNCAEMYEDECKQLQGSYQGDGADCDDVSCTALDGGCGDETGGSNDPGAIGACCVDDTCIENTLEECTERGGLWGGDQSTCNDEGICKLGGTTAPVEPAGFSCQSSENPPAFLLSFLLLFGLWRRRRS